jgi:hypothetical protein
MKKALNILLAGLIFMSCKKQNEYLPPDFNYKIEPVNITENVVVGAYYYNYTAADWNKKYTNTPLNGQYSALDPAIMETHRKWADVGGVDFFIFNWNGASGNSLLNNFIQGRNSNVKMVINFNTAHLSATNAAPLTGAKLTTMINEFKTLAANHFNKDYYYKVNGQPVVLITPLNLATAAAASIDYATVIPALKAEMSQIGVNLYVMGEITQGWLPPVRYAPAIKAVDAVDLTNWSTDIYDRSVFFHSFSDMNWKNWTDSTSKWKVDFIPTIFPAYNDKAMTPASKMYDLGTTPEFYTDYCNVAKRNMSNKRIVLINSWNNFQTGTSIEPTQEYGTTHLETTRKQFKVN